MADTSRTPIRHSWRKDPKKTSAIPRTNETSKIAAMHGVKPNKGPYWTPKRRRMLLGATLLIGLIVVVYVIRLILLPTPTGFVLIGSGYEQNIAIAHNAHGWMTLEDLAEIERNILHSPSILRADRSWESLLKQVKDSPRQKTILVYLALHGGADSKGPFLFLDSPRAKSKVYFKTVIRSLNDKWPNKNVLLILDPVQIEADWTNGMLYNGFVEGLESEQIKAEMAEMPKLMIICSAKAYQRSWVSPEWQRSIFGHYIAEGLKGAANTDGNNRLRVHELYEYVNKNVRAWADANRNAVQTPIFLGNEELARDTELRLVGGKQYEEQSPGLAPGLTAESSSKLKPAWDKWQELREYQPAPWIYAPHSWRRYQDTLVRYEQLLRLGDPTNKANQLQSDLIKLEQEIRNATILLQSSSGLSNSLPLAPFYGVDFPWKDAELRKAFRKFQTAFHDQLEDTQTAWSEVLETAQVDARGATRQRKQLLEAYLSNVVLNSLVSSEQEDMLDKKSLEKEELQRATKLLKDIHRRLNTGKARPVEAHTLVMLLWPGPGSSSEAIRTVPIEHVQLALRVRLLAEQTALATPDRKAGSLHPYSEVIWERIKPKIQDADEKRRRGEDWLFGADPQAWAQAKEAFEDAENLYRNIQPEIKIFREALNIRDRLFAELPYYARWAANQRNRLGTPDRAKKIERQLSTVEQMGKDLHQLVVLLPKAGKDDFGEIQSLTRTLREGLLGRGGLEEIFLKECRNLKATLQPNWHQIESLLAVPLLKELSLRKQLRETSQQISEDLHRKGNPVIKLFTNQKTLARETWRRASQEGRMALAVTQEPWLSKKTQRQALLSSINHLAGPNRSSSLTDAGEDIREEWDERLTQIDKGWLASLLDPNPTTARKNLIAPALLTRMVPGEFVDGLPSTPFDPVIALRRLRASAMLLGQTERTIADHWFAETQTLSNRGSPNSTYYIPAGHGYLADAETLLKTDVRGDEIRMIAEKYQVELPVQSKLDKERQSVCQDFRPKLGVAMVQLAYKSHQTEGTKRIPLTSQLAWKPEWQLSSDENVPQGHIMVWPEFASDSAKELFEDDPQWPSSKRIKALDRGPESVLRLELTRTDYDDKKEIPWTPRYKQAQVKLNGVYRGQYFSSPVDLTVQYGPEILVYRFPAPPEAKVAAIFDEDAPYGALSLVLDYSGSMDWDINGNPGGIRKIDHLLTALKAVLAKIPKKTHMSVMLFSPFDIQNKKLLSHKWVRKRFQWGGRQDIPALMNDLKRYKPDKGVSPIAKSIAMALQEGFPNGNLFQGPKVMLVLTDGMDTLLKGPWNRNGWNKLGTDPDKIKGYLQKQFKAHDDVMVNMVCFMKKPSSNGNNKNFPLTQKRQQTEAEMATKQFEDVITSWGGLFLIQEDPNKLAATLENSLRPKVHLLDTNNPRKPVSVVAYPFRYNKNMESVLESIRLWSPVQFQEKTFQTFIGSWRLGRLRRQQNLWLRSGEQMLLKVVPGWKGQLRLQRMLYGNYRKALNAPSVYPLEKWLKQEKWLATLQEPKYHTEQHFFMGQITLERFPSEKPGDEELLAHQRPGFVWVDLKGAKKKSVGAIRWHSVHNVPAPAVRVFGIQANQRTPPQVDLRWSSERFPPGTGKTIKVNPINPIVQQWRPIPGTTLPGEPKAQYKILSVRFPAAEKKRYVYVGPKKREQKLCMVVEVQYTGDDPVYLQPKGWSAGGAEHHFYTEARRYTALFWNFQNLAGPPYEFYVTSIGAFKSQYPATTWTNYTTKATWLFPKN